MSRVRRSRAAPRVTSVTRFTLPMALALASAVIATACSGSGSSSPATPAPPTQAEDEPTALEDLDTTALVVRRAPFCDAVDPAALARVLGEEPAGASAYRSGQRIRINANVADVVDEFGCRWTAGDDIAEAWVFAPPVTRRRADALSSRAGNRPECLDSSATPDFGRPSSACATGDGGTSAMSYQGLFGDAWLTCSLTLGGLGRREVDERASHWCAAVASAAARTG